MDTNNRVYTYTGHNGEKHQVPIERVNSLSQLQRGDHIALPRLAYWHHAIVEDIDKQKDEIHVIEYSNTARGFLEDNSSHPKNPGMAIIQRGTYKFHVGSVYLIKHGEYLNAEEVVYKAISRLGERNYHFIANNCESFALWCRTCISSSEQGKMVERGLVKVTEAIGYTVIILFVILVMLFTVAGIGRHRGVLVAPIRNEVSSRLRWQ